MSIVVFIGILLYFLLVQKTNIKGTIEARSTSIETNLLINKINFLQNFINVKEYTALAKELNIKKQEAIYLTLLKAKEIETNQMNVLSIEFEVSDSLFALNFPLILEKYITTDPVFVSINKSSFESYENNLDLVNEEINSTKNNAQNIVINENKTELFKYHYFLKTKLNDYTFFEVYNKNLIYTTSFGKIKIVLISLIAAFSISIMTFIIIELTKNILNEIK